jgi:hypothetical protein
MKPEILTPGRRLTVIAETEQDLNDVADAAASVLGDGSAEFYKRLTPPIGIGRSVARAAIEGFNNGMSPRAAEHLAALGLEHIPAESRQAAA